MDATIARNNMLKQQIRTANVFDDALLNVIKATPREHFVSTANHALAYADTELAIGFDQVMMRPQIEAQMLQALQLQAMDKVLEIGTGSGYVTALLAKSCLQVYSVDIFPELLEKARAKLAQLTIENVILQEGNGAAGWPAQPTYDVICMTGSLPLLPKNLPQQLKIGGRLFVILGSTPIMEATLITRIGERNWVQEKLFETVLKPLLHARELPKFSF